MAGVGSRGFDFHSSAGRPTASWQQAERVYPGREEGVAPLPEERVTLAVGFGE